MRRPGWAYGGGPRVASTPVTESSHARAPAGVRPRAPTALLAAAICTAALALTACAGSGTRRIGGRALFSQACGACHTLSVGRRVTQGGNLRALHIPRSAMLQFVGEMPVRHRLDSRQLGEVTDYVLGVERGG